MSGVDGLQTFAVAGAGAEGARAAREPAVRDGRALIDFRGGPGTVPALSFSKVMSGNFDRGLVRGRVVVVGASAPSLHDVHHTSTSGGSVMAGPELQASSISTLMRGAPLNAVPPLVGVLGVLLMAFVAPLASIRLRPLGIAAVSLAALVAYAAG